MPALLSSTTVRALSAPIETNIRSLLMEYGYADGEELLPGLAAISNVLIEHSLRCTPPLGTGDLDAPRILAPLKGGALGVALSEIAEGETSNVEFKSTFLIDTKKLAYAPGRPAQEYVSDAVVRSALKTISAFANCGGGVLYLGVADDGSICGLAADFAAANQSRADYDGWDQHFRNLIGSRLSDGQTVNQYVQTNCYRLEDGTQFVQARIASRTRLTFVKTEGSWELFMRAGTQTKSIPYAEIEQHFSLTRLY